MPLDYGKRRKLRNDIWSLEMAEQESVGSPAIGIRRQFRHRHPLIRDYLLHAHKLANRE